MSTPIRIKRRSSPGLSGAPNSLLQAELAFNENDKILYYGFGVGVGGNSSSIIGIAGEGAFVTLSTDQTIGGNKTFSNAISASLTNSLSIGAGLSQNGTSYNGGVARTISLPLVGTAGTYGSSTLIPVITTDAYGRVSSVSTSSISTTINLSGNSGSGSVAGGGTLAISGGTGILTSVTGSGVTVSIDSTVATLTGSQVLTNKTINSASNTIQLNGNQIIGYTGSGSSVVLSTSPSLTTPSIGAATATSITGSSGNLSITAASGNNNINLVPTGTGTVDVASARITNLADPKLPLDAVNKQYADAIASSINIHGEVQAATASSISYTYVGGGTSQTITTISSNVVTFSSNHGLSLNSQVRSNNTANGLTSGTTYYVITTPALNQVTLSTTPGGNTTTLTDGSGLNISTTTNQGVGAQLTGTGQTVDGYNVVVGDRILVKDHTTASYNGVYVVTTVGTGSNGVWTRATDFDNSPTGEISAGDYVFVALGTVNAKFGFVQTTIGPIVIGTTSLNFTQFTAAGNYIAGTGITISGTTISISNTYSGQSSITTVGTISTGTWNGVGITVPYGGTGAASFTSKGILYGNGTGAIQVTVAAGTGDSNTSNQILTVDGNNNPIWASAIDGGTY